MGSDSKWNYPRDLAATGPSLAGIHCIAVPILTDTRSYCSSDITNVFTSRMQE